MVSGPKYFIIFFTVRNCALFVHHYFHRMSIHHRPFIECQTPPILHTNRARRDVPHRIPYVVPTIILTTSSPVNKRETSETKKRGGPRFKQGSQRGTASSDAPSTLRTPQSPRTTNEEDNSQHNSQGRTSNSEVVQSLMALQNSGTNDQNTESGNRSPFSAANDVGDVADLKRQLEAMKSENQELRETINQYKIKTRDEEIDKKAKNLALQAIQTQVTLLEANLAKEKQEKVSLAATVQ